MAKPQKEETQNIEIPDQVKVLIVQGLEACRTPNGYDMQKYMSAFRSSMTEEEYRRFEGALVRHMQPVGFIDLTKATWNAEGVKPKIVVFVQGVGVLFLGACFVEALGAGFGWEQIRVLSMGARTLLGD